MLRSLFSGISGLRVNQTMLDVTGNNISNANTVGFKSSQTVFSDTLSQMLTAAAAPAASGNTGGTDPVQIGLGVQVAAVKTNFTQGANETTGVATDMMLSGDGFFVVNDGQNNYLTRAGAFSFDQDGDMVAPDGKYVQGYAGISGYNADGSPSYSADTGAAGLSKLNLTSMAQNATQAAHDSGLTDSTGGPVKVGDALQSYEIGSDGTVTGTFAGGEKLALGRIAVANVQNPQGLEKSGDSEYVASANSGTVVFATAGANTTVGQNGKITTGALEMSNVDLSSEFTNLILAQRGFEASSKVITTSDTVLGDLINMIH